MKDVFAVVQIVVSVLLMVAILLQAKGTGLGTAWGGSGEFYRSRRGVERVVFIGTIILAVLFLISSIIGVRVS